MKTEKKNKINVVIIIALCLVLTIVNLQAQNYQINFIGSGASSAVDSVKVENISQFTEMTLIGSDILNLVAHVGIEVQDGFENYMRIYPNPMSEEATLEFYSNNNYSAIISIYSISGNLLKESSQQIIQGINAFEIKGLATGIYSVNIKTSEWQKTLNIVSIGERNAEVSIYSKKTTINKNKLQGVSDKNVVQMQFNDGDTLLFKGMSGNYARVLILIPNQSQAVNFNFVPCSDNDGNNYSVVSIGTQLWMAENLKYLPSVVPADSGSVTTPLFYVHSYVGTNVNDAKTTLNFQKYGVLYNWTAAMNGGSSSSSNPSGVQGVCPVGWHLPSDAEWNQLAVYLGGVNVAGGKLKHKGLTLWSYPNAGATNEVGFTALPAGGRIPSGIFGTIGEDAVWWSATEYNLSNSWVNGIFYPNKNLYTHYQTKEMGYSIRCVKN